MNIEARRQKCFVKGQGKIRTHKSETSKISNLKIEIKEKLRSTMSDWCTALAAKRYFLDSPNIIFIVQKAQPGAGKCRKSRKVLIKKNENIQNISYEIFQKF